MPHYTVHITLTTTPENVDKVVEAIKLVYEPIRKEPENVSFDLYQHEDEPGVLRIAETWYGTETLYMEKVH